MGARVEEISSEQLMVCEWMQSAGSGRRMELMGQLCARCGVTGFPKSARCKACGSGELRQVILTGPAILHSVTIDTQGTFLGTPYLVGQAQFPEGPFVQGFIEGEVENPPAIGAELELVPFEVPAPGEEGTLTTYGFRPKGHTDA